MVGQDLKRRWFKWIESRPRTQLALAVCLLPLFVVIGALVGVMEYLAEWCSEVRRMWRELR